MSADQQLSPLERIKAAQAAKEAAKAALEADKPAEIPGNFRIFFGDFPQSLSFMTEKGAPIYFYQGFHVTDDEEIAEYCAKLKNVKEVTDKVKLEDIPKAPIRSRSSNWASAAKTEITPMELLQRIAVVSSKGLPQAAESNS